MRARFERMFGGGGGGPSRGGGRRQGFSLPLLLGALALGWLATGVYTVDEGEQAVVLQLGNYNRTTGPGIHMHLPAPIETREVVNVTGQRIAEIGFAPSGPDLRERNDRPNESLMITGDRNIVEVHFRIVYNISDVVAYTFNVRDADDTVRMVAESAMREVVGGSELEPLITTERAEAGARAEELMRTVLEDYDIGVYLISVELLSARYPQAVIEAFNDVLNARQEAATAINNANRDTARIVNEAEAYRERVMREATGEAERFLSVYEEYRQAPQVTRDRIYLKTMEEVYRKGNLIILDTNGGAVPYLPVDNLLRRQQTGAAQGGQ